MNTDYIDLLWVHAWDYLTPVEEVMKGLDDLISSGKVLYIGISDTPAWIVARANTMAELRGWNKFAGLQIEYSLIERTVERELIPMAKELGLAVTPWAPLGGGLLTGKYLNGNPENSRMEKDNPRFTDKNLEIVKKVIDISNELNVSPAQLSLRWVMQKGCNQIPIIGARKLSQLEDSLKVTGFEIPEDKMLELNSISEIELGFPHRFLNNERIKEIVFGGTRDKIIK